MTSMTNNELLLFAAKAAGYPDAKYEAFAGMEERHGYAEAVYSDILANESGSGYWNPAESDGDSRRLQAKLRLTLEFSDDGNEVRCDAWSGYHWTELCEDYPAKAARLAVLMVAAELGKSTSHPHSSTAQSHG